MERAEAASHRSMLLPALGGLVLGCTEVLLVVSLAALIFSGPLTVHLPAAVGAFLLGGAAVMAWLAWRSTMPGAVGSAQDAPAVILSLIAASIAARLPPGDTETFLTVMLAIVLSALLTGVLSSPLVSLVSATSCASCRTR